MNFDNRTGKATLLRSAFLQNKSPILIQMKAALRDPKYPLDCFNYEFAS